ncbi:DUF2207 domain-containing protein [Phycicoccus sp. CSK15P-2]|uniref:DUF2207 domain-containing protein n=1 Tax=Phycicoccus sp. CSK15P-2 TaxID=2807627 RepID=UPI0019518046|nr:DUF2207 domain-containing protein [Phycicoccus sp. CSK15P-2]MBM6404355.1 DUF2207 domain-containing protein [Phycicoccus sp. CSK15P-2]
MVVGAGVRRPVALVLVPLVGALLSLLGTAVPVSAAPAAADPPGLTSWGAAAEPQEEAAEQLHTTIEAQADGSVLVTEDIVWRFPAGEERHGIYRSVRVRAGYRDSEARYRYYELSGVEVTSPSGAPTDILVEDFGASRKIRIGSPTQTVTGTAHYIVSYRLAHLVNDIGDGTAEVSFDVLDTSNDVPHEDVEAEVGGPAPVLRVACFYGEFGADDECSGTAEAVARFDIPPLAPREGATVVVSFPREAFGDLAPDLREGSATASSASPLSPAVERLVSWAFIGAGVLLPLLAAAGMGMLVWTRGRDEQYAGLTPGLSPGYGESTPVVVGGPRPTVAVQFTPPAGVQPGLVGTIIDEDAGVVDVSATIVDLAVRGYLTIGRDDTGRFRADDWTLTRTAPPATAVPLRGYEQALLDGVFAEGSVIRLSSLKNRFAPTLAAVQRLMYEEVAERGWFRASPEQQRARWMVFGTLLAFGSVVVSVVVAVFLGSVFSGVVGFPGMPTWVLTGGLVATGLVIRSLGRRMAARTAEGSAVLAQSRGFQQYLVTAEANQIRWEEAQDVFSRFLPYAIVFGVADRWAAVFEDVAAAAAAAGHTIGVPVWYGGSWNDGGFGDVAASMDSFSTVAAGTMVSTPGSSGTSGFSAGGGFSGGGGGGSSGGSW